MVECVNCGEDVEAQFFEAYLMQCHVFWRCEIEC